MKHLQVATDPSLQVRVTTLLRSCPVPGFGAQLQQPVALPGGAFPPVPVI